MSNFLEYTKLMTEHLRDQWKRWQGGMTESLRGRHEHARMRVTLLAWVGTICMPLFYVIWHFFFAQEYESPTLRAIGFVLCVIGLFARRFSNRWLDIYLAVALTYLFAFFFSFMFLMNHASAVWTQSLLVALIVLFHFDIAMAMLAYVLGTALACAAVLAIGRADLLLQREVWQQVPIHWFTIVALSVARVGRSVLAQEKLAGLGAGLATVAHELRTPLISVDANVRGLTRLLHNSAPCVQSERDAGQDALGRIQFEVRHMHHMIDLFLLSASVVNHNLRPNEAVSMAGAVESVLKRYPFTGHAQQQTVAVELRGNFIFAGQSELCVIILLNLLRNALKAIHRAGKGRVRIIVDGARRSPRLLFIDTGCGIAPSQMPLIFRRFYSFPPHNGSGIGLALCKDIMAAWEATIRCVSREHAYAIFVLEFPPSARAPLTA
ncbi:MAG: HAMP domain-containing sensor histidine kinase [Pseudomonadota bacterium]